MKYLGTHLKELPCTFAALVNQYHHCVLPLIALQAAQPSTYDH